MILENRSWLLFVTVATVLKFGVASVSFKVMKLGVLLRSYNLQIFQAVIGWVAISMVNKFTTDQFSAQSIFHNQSGMFNFRSVYPACSPSIFRKSFWTFIKIAMFSRAPIMFVAQTFRLCRIGAILSLAVGWILFFTDRQIRGIMPSLSRVMYAAQSLTELPYLAAVYRTHRIIFRCRLRRLANWITVPPQALIMRAAKVATEVLIGTPGNAAISYGSH